MHSIMFIACAVGIMQYLLGVSLLSVVKSHGWICMNYSWMLTLCRRETETDRPSLLTDATATRHHHSLFITCVWGPCQRLVTRGPCQRPSPGDRVKDPH